MPNPDPKPTQKVELMVYVSPNTKLRLRLLAAERGASLSALCEEAILALPDLPRAAQRRGLEHGAGTRKVK